MRGTTTTQPGLQSEKGSLVVRPEGPGFRGGSTFCTGLCSGLVFNEDHWSAADAGVMVSAARTVAHLLDADPAPASFVRARQEDSLLNCRHSSPLLSPRSDIYDFK